MANKLKKLKLRPSARDRRRYFLVGASSSNIEDAILDYVGVLGFAKSAYMKVDVSREGKWKLKEGYIVGSCLVKSLEEVRAALGLMGMRIERVSGTLRGLRASG